MPLAVKINAALREQNCQKIGSERVNWVALYTKKYQVSTYTFQLWLQFIRKHEIVILTARYINNAQLPFVFLWIYRFDNE